MKVKCLWCSSTYEGETPLAWATFTEVSTLDDGERVRPSALCPAHAAELRVWLSRAPIDGEE